MAIKVFQWASGTVGRHAAREVIDREGLALVGLHVRSPDKAGQDIGTLLDRGPLGIPATDRIQTVLDSDADLVLHAPLPSEVYGERESQDLEDICQLLAAGKNVITVVGYLYPAARGPEVVRALESACARGGSTFHSTGLNPGFMGDLLPLVLSSLARSVDQVVVREISNFQGYPSPEIMFESMGFGQSVGDFKASSDRRRRWLDGLFSESIQMVADGLGIELDEIRQEMDLARAPEDLETASGLVRAGTVAGQRWLWAGVVDGRDRIVHETIWRMHASVAPEWPDGKHSIVLAGEPRMALELEADWIADGLLATAMHAVNAIEPVCRARAGIRTLLDFPELRGRMAK